MVADVLLNLPADVQLLLLNHPVDVQLLLSHPADVLAKPTD